MYSHLLWICYKTKDPKSPYNYTHDVPCFASDEIRTIIEMIDASMGKLEFIDASASLDGYAASLDKTPCLEKVQTPECLRRCSKLFSRIPL